MDEHLLLNPSNRAARQPPRTSALKVTAPPRTPAPDQTPVRKGSPAVKAESSVKGKDGPSRPGSSYPAVKTSNLDLDAKPVYEPNGKSITDIDMDAGTSSLNVINGRKL